jgi:ribonuclease BN (tRNA processing enzyme)
MTMSLQILGASCAVPNPDQATSSYLLRADDTTVLLECGHGAVGKLRKFAAPEELDAVVITHMHPDHCLDLVALRNYLYVHALPPLPVHLPVNGPAVLRELAAALQLPADYFDRTFTLHTYSPDQSFAIGAVLVESLTTRHNTIANAVRFTAPGGGSLVFSSDTGWFAELAEFARPADVLLIELTDRVTPEGTDRWHLCPRDAARIINAAQPPVALLTHYFADAANAIRAAVSAECPQSRVQLAIEGEVHHVGG